MEPSQFNAGDPIAFLITWTTYGTWLPGDERGWNRRGLPDCLLPNQFLVDMNSAKMLETPFRLNQDDRKCVEQTIERHCEIRRWTMHAGSARSNHVHVVVSAADTQPEMIRDQLKAWCTRMLKTSYPNRIRFWTQSASIRWINLEPDLDAAVRYVAEAQNRKGVE